MKNLVKLLLATLFLFHSLVSSGQHLGYSFEELQREREVKIIEKQGEGNLIAVSFLHNEEGEELIEYQYILVDNEVVAVFMEVKSPDLLFELIKVYNESKKMERVAKYRWQSDEIVIMISKFTKEGALITALLNDKEKVKKGLMLFFESIKE